jgi:hypothetical protein
VWRSELGHGVRHGCEHLDASPQRLPSGPGPELFAIDELHDEKRERRFASSMTLVPQDGWEALRRKVPELPALSPERVDLVSRGV